MVFKNEITMKDTLLIKIGATLHGVFAKRKNNMKPQPSSPGSVEEDTRNPSFWCQVLIKEAFQFFFCNC